MIHKVFKSDIFKSIILSSFKRSFQPINLFVGVVLGYISPIAFPKECSYLWCLSMIKFSPSHLGEEVFFSLLISIQSTVSVVAEFRLYLEKFSISPLQAYSFRCWFFQQLRSNLLGRVLSKIICGRSWHFLLHSFIPMIYLLFLLLEAWWCCSLHSSSRIVRIVFFSY